MSDKRQKTEVPDHVIESFARCILPGIRKYFDSEEGQKEFKAWKAKRNNNELKNSN